MRQVAELDRLIADMDQHKVLAEDTSKLRQFRARLLSPEALTQDINMLKQTLEARCVCVCARASPANRVRSRLRELSP